MRVLVFGDSITYGAVDKLGGWADRLKQHYNKERAADNYERDYPSVYNQGVSGDTAEDILVRLKIEAEARRHGGEESVFVLAVGTNDSVINDGKPRYSIEQFQKNYKGIIKEMQGYSDQILLVGLLPVNEELTTPIPWRPNRHYTNKQIKMFDEAIQNIAKELRLPYVHLFKPFDKKLNLFPDGLHPNDDAHELIKSLVLPELEKLLN